MKIRAGVCLLIFFWGFITSGLLAQENQQQPAEMRSGEEQGVSDAFQEHFFEALKQKAIENYEKAVKALKECEKLQPENAVIHFELGKNFMLLKQPEKAVSSLERAHNLETGNEWIMAELMNAYSATGAYEEAIKLAGRLVKTNSRFYKDLADLYWRSNSYAELSSLLDELDNQYGAADYREDLRRRLAKTSNSASGSREAALENMEKPSGGQYQELIKVYREKGPERAVTAFQQLIPTGTQPEVKFRIIKEMLEYTGANPGSGGELQEILSLLAKEQSDPFLHLKLGEYYLLNEEKEKALAEFEAGAKLDPEDFELIRNLLQLQLEMGKYTDVINTSKEALEIFPAQPNLYLTRGKALVKLGKHREAEEAFIFGLDYVVEDDRISREFYEQLAQVYSALGDTRKAEEYRQKSGI